MNNKPECLQFVVHPMIQNLLIKIHEILIDNQYLDFGKITELGIGDIKGEIPEYNIVLPDTFGSSRRKPTTPMFQQYCSDIYFPLIQTFYFGTNGWKKISKHLLCFKLNTIKRLYLVKDVYHMHLDAKVGILNEKNIGQKHISRILTSYSAEYLKKNKSTKITITENQRLFGCTVYPIVQPKTPFSSIKKFHEYMESLYEECGLNNKYVPTPRQNYKIMSNKVIRLLPGETVLHKSHTLHKSQPIHSEPNPNPTGNRYALIWDFKNIINYEGVKIINNVPVPHEQIISLMKVLSNPILFFPRLQQAIKILPNLIKKSSIYHGTTTQILQLLELFQESNLNNFQ